MGKGEEDGEEDGHGEEVHPGRGHRKIVVLGCCGAIGIVLDLLDGFAQAEQHPCEDAADQRAMY